MTGLTRIVRGPSVSPALLQLEHVPLDFLPRQRAPFIHQLCFSCGHNVWTANDASTFQMIVFLSAYLAAFPRALASETIPPLHRMRLIPARHLTGRER
jgi:hypothetical protein